MCEFEKSFVNFLMPSKKSKAIATTAPSADWQKKQAPTELSYEHYCLLDSSTGECAQPSGGGAWAASMSIVYHFYGSDLVNAEDGEWDCSLLDADLVNAKAAALVAAMDSESGQLQYGFFMRENTASKGYTSITRSAISVAGPLCLSKDGEAGAGECFDFASGDLDMFSEQANEYVFNLIGPWILGKFIEKTLQLDYHGQVFSDCAAL